MALWAFKVGTRLHETFEDAEKDAHAQAEKHRHRGLKDVVAIHKDGALVAEVHPSFPPKTVKK